MARSRRSTNARLWHLTQATLARHDHRADSWLGTTGTYCQYGMLRRAIRLRPPSEFGTAG
jgi:hypothetical protein